MWVNRGGNLLALASLSLCAVATALWPWSCLRSDNFGWNGRTHHFQLTSSEGDVLFFWMPVGAPGDYRVGHAAFRFSDEDFRPSLGRNVLGFVFEPAAAHGGTMSFVGVPLWFVALALAVLPTVVGHRRWVRRSRRSAGRCLTCGYDLRAAGGRCPECGTAPESA